MSWKFISVVAIIAVFEAFSGCGSNSSSSYDTTTAEVLGESIGGAAKPSDDRTGRRHRAS